LVELFEMTENETTARAVLSAAIKDAAAADAVALRAREAVTSAAGTLREAEHDLKSARAALERARTPQRPLADVLADAYSDAEREAIVEEHNSAKRRPAPTIADIRALRDLVADGEDRSVVAKADLDRLQASATSTETAARRANDRRRQAINAVCAPEAIRLMGRVQGLTRELADARLSLKFVGANLADGHSDERRQIQRMIDMDLGQMFAHEFGFKAEPSAALAAWKAFAESVTRDSSTPFPST
jgi:hypothetical protein